MVEDGDLIKKNVQKVVPRSSLIFKFWYGYLSDGYAHILMKRNVAGVDEILPFLMFYVIEPVMYECDSSAHHTHHKSARSSLYVRASSFQSYVPVSNNK